MTKPASTDFRFAGFDAGPCAFLVIVGLGSLPLLSPLGYPYGLYALAGLLALALGMRFTITVT